MSISQAKDAVNQNRTRANPVPEYPSFKKSISTETFIFIAAISLFFGVTGTVMGAVNLMNTIMNTAYDLLIATCFYLMAITVVAGALSELLSEFGVISLFNKLLAPVMKPVFGLPGASIVGVFATYFLDNPAILPLAANHNFRRYFKKYQVPALTNLGTAFGMGMIVLAFMIRIPAPEGENFLTAALIGTLGAVVGALVSTRIMLFFTSRLFGKTDDEEIVYNDSHNNDFDILKFRSVRQGTVGTRALEAMLDGGKSGVEVGLSIIPGILVICTIIKLTGASTTAILSTFEPITSVVLGILILHEVISSLKLIGCAFIMASIMLIAIGESKSDLQKQFMKDEIKPLLASHTTKRRYTPEGF